MYKLEFLWDKSPEEKEMLNSSHVKHVSRDCEEMLKITWKLGVIRRKC